MRSWEIFISSLINDLAWYRVPNSIFFFFKISKALFSYILAGIITNEMNNLILLLSKLPLFSQKLSEPLCLTLVILKYQQ